MMNRPPRWAKTKPNRANFKVLGKEQSAQESPPAKRHSSELKKQSQSAPDQIDVKSAGKKDYDNTAPAGTGENKANQSQFLSPADPIGVGQSPGG